jgi:hypothetical protein
MDAPFIAKVPWLPVLAEVGDSETATVLKYLDSRFELVQPVPTVYF